MAQSSITFVSAVNDFSILENNLLQSPIIKSGKAKLLIETDHNSASIAYNEALSKINSGIVVFAHQDVYFPNGWERLLYKGLKKINDKKWAIVGIIGITKNGFIVGKSWSNGLNMEISSPLNVPYPIVSIDEIVIVMNKKNLVRFDEKLPGFHLYGTDIVQNALIKDYKAYVINAPVIHNSLPIKFLGRDYIVSYRYMQKKWRNQLPLNNVIVKITKFGMPLAKYYLSKYKKHLLHKMPQVKRHENPLIVAKKLDYE